MSNSSLIDRIESSLNAVRAGELPASSFAKLLQGNGRALEAMPYELIKEMESLAMDFEIAAWHDEDGFLPDLAKVLSQTEAWLQKLPREV